MGAEITSRTLPGVGVSQDATLHGGHRVGVVTRRDGLRELVVYAPNGDDAARVELTEDEAGSIAELLGSPSMVARLEDLRHQAAQLVTEQLAMPENSPYAGQLLGTIGARSRRMRASIVGVLRPDAAHVAPGADFMLHGGDVVLAVGTREGVDQLSHILDGTG